MKLQLSPLGRSWSGGCWRPAETACPDQRASSVEDPGGVSDDPGVGHEPGVDPDVGDPLVPLLLARAVLRELVQGEGHLARGQPHVERKFLILGFIRMLAGNVVPLDDFVSAEIFVLVDVFQIVAGIIAPLSICRLGSGLDFFASVDGSFFFLRIVCSLWHFVGNFCEKFLVGVVEIFKRTFVGITCSLWHFDGSAEIFAIFGFCLITARAGHILVFFVLFVLPLFKLVQQQDGVSWWQRSSEPILDVPDNVTPEAAEPVALAGAAAAEVAAVRPAPQVSLRHLAGCDGRPKPLP